MTNQIESTPVLVVGATGKQGGAVARALLARGQAVRALVRDPHSPGAQALKALGAELVRGDLQDTASLREACAGVRAVFSMPPLTLETVGTDAERVMGANLVRAAKEAGVPQFVHTSVSGAGDFQRNAPGWKEGRWDVHYWESKASIEALVRDAGFRSWTVLKPAFFMENFVRPSALFAHGTGDRLMTVLKPQTVIALIAVKDIGEAGAAALLAPEKFHRVELELAGERLTMTDIARILGEAWNVSPEAPDITPEEALAQGMPPAFVKNYQQLNEVGSPATPEQARSLGLPLTDFKTWAHSVAG
ncbi:NmrA/HSCARG family protein [Archangium primigenium]|uniref:NmrA/HSCARG family protein n=1 Tax=[Archangium] primigenium TaxID=2792470 RepID=UPI00195A8054|nr:NmrA/HSCARG family protein [Archangium primigenium]MBM7115048.1 NmrA/HSCARG family protein [Archangium primigenium]